MAEQEKQEQLTLLDDEMSQTEDNPSGKNLKSADKPRANQLDGKTWTRHSISIWSDLHKTKEEKQLKHPAMFPLGLAGRAIECFMNEEDRTVLDPFVGVGTTVIAARNAGKYGIGIDISPEFAKVANERLGRHQIALEDSSEVIHMGEGVIITDDAHNLGQHVDPESIDFCLTSPPYWDILLRDRTADYKDRRDYGDTEQDIGKIGDYEQFLAELGSIMKGVFTALRPGKYCLMVVMDIRKKANFYPFHSDLASAMQGFGFIYDDLIIWDRRHEYNNMRPLGYPYKFRINKAHEYILIFQKPQ